MFRSASSLSNASRRMAKVRQQGTVADVALRREKIEADPWRDANTNIRLRSLGWTVLRFWSHEPPTEAAQTVTQVLALADSKHRSASPSVNEKN